MSEMLHGGQILAKALKQEGIKRIYTLGGDHTMAMYYGFIDEDIEVVDARHESAAIAMAIGEARATGKPAVAVITAGPGLANTFGAVIDAYQDGTPVLIVSGGSAIAQNQIGSMQEFDLLPSFKPVTKWADRCYATNRIGDYVHIAFRHMTAIGKTGPALLEVPYDVVSDVADASAAADPGNTRAENIVLGDPVKVEQAAKLLVEAKRPVMVINRDVGFYPSNLEYLGKLADHLHMLTGSMFEAKGLLDETNPANSLGLAATGMADVILLVNVIPDFAYDFLNPPRFNPNAKYIFINTDATMIGFNQPYEIGIIGTPGDVCKQIYECVAQMTEPRADYDFLQEVGAMLAPYGEMNAAKSADSNVPISPYRASADVLRFINEHPEYDFVNDGGDAASNITGGLANSRPRRMVYSGRYGAIGFALPIAIGTHYANGNKVIMTTGDGALGFFLGELTTMVGRNLPMIVVCFNDSGWGMIREMEHAIHPETYAKYASDPKNDIATMNLPMNLRYDQIVAGLGGYGEMVTDPNEIYPALKRAEESGKPALINIIINNNVEQMTDCTRGFGLGFAGLVKY